MFWRSQYQSKYKSKATVIKKDILKVTVRRSLWWRVLMCYSSCKSLLPLAEEKIGKLPPVTISPLSTSTRQVKKRKDLLNSQIVLNWNLALPSRSSKLYKKPPSKNFTTSYISANRFSNAKIYFLLIKTASSDIYRTIHENGGNLTNGTLRNHGMYK